MASGTSRYIYGFLFTAASCAAAMNISYNSAVRSKGFDPKTFKSNGAAVKSEGTAGENSANFTSSNSVIKIGIDKFDVKEGEKLEIESDGGIKYVCGDQKGTADSVRLEVKKNLFGTVKIYLTNKKGRTLAKSESSIYLCPADASENYEFYKNLDFQNFADLGCRLIKKSENKDGHISVIDKSYRGILAFSLKLGNENYAQTVNVLPLNDYLKGVLPGEVPVNFHNETLKAMACVARSYALKHLNKHEAEGYDLCSTVHCQVYEGKDKENSNVNEQINLTSGQIVCFGKQIADTLYCSTCGGMSDSAASIWSDKADDSAYLKACSDLTDGSVWNLGCGQSAYASDSEYSSDYEEGSGDVNAPEGTSDKPAEEKTVLFIENTEDTEAAFRSFINSEPSAYCSKSSRFRWNKEIPVSEFNAMIKESLPKEKICGADAAEIGELKDIKVTKRTAGGRCAELVIATDKGTFKVCGDNTRCIVSKGRISSDSLNSSLFYVDFDGEKVVFKGGGWGHGVGMCQMGAYGRALEGQKYNDIISHYYPGCEIVSASSK